MLQLVRRAFSRDTGYFLLALSPQHTTALRVTSGTQKEPSALQFLSNFTVSLIQVICKGRCHCSTPRQTQSVLWGH